MLGKIEGRSQRRGVTEDEIAGWHQQLNGHESEQTVGDIVEDREALHAVVREVTKSWA